MFGKKMLKIGLTGNIGSGKTLVAEVFRTLGVPVFHADEAARNLLSDDSVINDILDYFGEEVLSPERQINRKALAGKVFNDSEKLEFLNALIHPRVRELFDQWCRVQSGKIYVLYEAAILFESGHYREMDRVICVDAPEALRLRRVMMRDGATEAEVRQRMDRQWPDERKTALADYIIRNDETEPVIPQVLNIHRILTSLSNSKL